MTTSSPEVVPAVVATGDTMSGAARIDSTRLPVALILGLLESGMTAADVYRDYPHMPAESVTAALRYARRVVEGVDVALTGIDETEPS